MQLMPLRHGSMVNGNAGSKKGRRQRKFMQRIMNQGHVLLPHLVFHGGLVPGDGVHVVFPLLMGTNRGRYFLLTGQTLSANEARELGLVNEVLPREQLLDRAWAHARMLMQRPPLLRRYARVLLTQDLKKRMQELLGYGLALEGLAATQRG